MVVGCALISAALVVSWGLSSGCCFLQEGLGRQSRRGMGSRPCSQRKTSGGLRAASSRHAPATPRQPANRSESLGKMPTTCVERLISSLASEQVSALDLFPVMRREVTEDEDDFTSLGHGFSCLGERGGDHGAHMIQWLQYSLFLMKELLRHLCPSAVCSHRRRAHHAAALAPTILWCSRW